MIVGVGSWRGIGATTTALAIAARWVARGMHPWLIEADPAGGMLAARLADPTSPNSLAHGSLERVAFPAQRASGRDRFEHAATEWCGMRIVTAPGDPFRAWSCHQPRSPWAPSLRELDEPVVVDLGRVRGGGPVDHVLHQLDAVLLVTSADAVDVVATVEWATVHGRVATTDRGLAADLARVLVVDSPHASTRRDRTTRTTAETELGDRFAGWLPWSPAAVELLYGGAAPTDRRLRRQSYVHAVDHLVDRLARWCARPRAGELAGSGR